MTRMDDVVEARRRAVPGLRTLRAMVRLAPLDMRRLMRDDLLSWLAGMPLVLVVALRLGAEPLVEALGARGLDVSPWLPLTGAVAFAVVVPVMVGTVVGFMFLADKEDGTWRAVAVTPVSLRGYLTWRAALATGLAGPATLLGLCLGGINDVDWGAAAGLALAAAPLAGTTALGLAAFTDSTVQGVAAVKLGFVVLVLPAVAIARGGLWAIVLVAVPSWWPLRAHAAVLGAEAWTPWAAGSVLVGAVLVAFCLHRAARSAVG